MALLGGFHWLTKPFFPRALLVLLALLAKMVAMDILVWSDLLAFVALRVAKVLL